MAKKTKKCDCVNWLQNKLNERYKQEVELLTSPTINLETGAYSDAIPPLYFKYKDGNRTKKSHVKFSHCPFCGVKYEA